MLIQVTSGTGRGPTKLSAYDAALREAGVANLNLLTLSSVIPPAAEVREVAGANVKLSARWGDRLYVVQAHQEVETPNEEAWAGVGWVTNAETGQGLFVEHEGFAEDQVRRDIADTLRSMVEGRDVEFGDVQMKVRGVRCDHEPVCALVVAAYESASWATADLDAQTL